MKIASPRERAFFCLMAQSGLRPSTIVALKIKDVERILDENTPIPCLIMVKKENTKGKFAEYFTFIGKDSVLSIKDYLKTRINLSSEDYLFTKMGKEDKPLNAGVESHLFERLAKKLKDKGILDFKISKKEFPQTISTKERTYEREIITRSEFRLYNLRKFFRKYGGQAGMDFVNFWMGHLNAGGVDLHYFSKDVEHHRQVYREKAMPFLRLQSQTPTETEQTIASQQKAIEELKKENQALRLQLQELPELKERIERTELFIKTWQNVPKATMDAFIAKIKEKEESKDSKKAKKKHNQAGF
jgi:integrase